MTKLTTLECLEVDEEIAHRTFNSGIITFFSFPFITILWGKIFENSGELNTLEALGLLSIIGITIFFMRWLVYFILWIFRPFRIKYLEMKKEE